VLACYVMKAAKEDLHCHGGKNHRYKAGLKHKECTEAPFRACYNCKKSAARYFKSALFRNTLAALRVDIPPKEYIRRFTDLADIIEYFTRGIKKNV
jgi:hypothetical protein